MKALDRLAEINHIDELSDSDSEGEEEDSEEEDSCRSDKSGQSRKSDKLNPKVEIPQVMAEVPQIKEEEEVKGPIETLNIQDYHP